MKVPAGIPECTVDLTQSPSKRWQLSPGALAQARLLVDQYFTDLGGSDDMLTPATELLTPHVPPDKQAEMEAIAQALDLPPPLVLTSNAC